MVEPLEAAAAAEACFADDLLLLDFPSAAAPACGGKLRHQSLLDIVESIPGLTAEGGGGEAEEEEELEWLSNKDAFPALETSFEVPTDRRPSPVSVLAAAPPLRVPVRPRSKGRRRSRRVLPVFAPPEAALAVKRGEKRKCRHCEAEETPQWRAGPEGPKTLCNACGVRYKSGRLVPEYRPASSPSFSALLHSNSHRRIQEMRRRRGAPRGRRSARAPPLVPSAGPAL